MLLNQMGQQLGLVEAVNAAIPDTWDSRYVHHSQLSLLRQRIYGLCLGYEGLNDHDQLRSDLGVQTAVGRESPLGSSPTLCRLENRADRAMAVALHRVMVAQFIDSFKRVPKKLVLDFDATDDRVHGDQQGKFFTVTMIITVSYRCMCIVKSNCWSVTFSPARLMGRNMPGRS